MRKCLACGKHISIGELLDCSKCNKHYHYSCVCIPEDYFNANKHDLERTWTCPICTKTTRPRRNDNTPVRSQLSPMIDISQIPIDNVTIRKQTSNPNDDVYSEDDLSLLGHTIEHEVSTNFSQLPRTLSTTNLLDQIEALLDRKLDTIKLSLLSELKSTIERVTLSQISKQKQEMVESINMLSSEQNKFKKDLEKNSNMINELKFENQKLQKEIVNLKKIMATYNNPITKTTNVHEENSAKKIILYGLEENRWESEYELYNRVIFAFRDILNIDLEGYIEDVKRLGNRGNRRPLLIELLSKNVTKRILQNRRLFKSTGLSVSEMLDSESLQVRKNLVKILIDARKNGRRANIIDNRLIIDGQEHKLCNDISDKLTIKSDTIEPPREAERKNKSFQNRSFRN